MIAIIDYDAGNLEKRRKSADPAGRGSGGFQERETILEADKVILPGVGSLGTLWGN